MYILYLCQDLYVHVFSSGCGGIYQKPLPSFQVPVIRWTHLNSVRGLETSALIRIHIDNVSPHHPTIPFGTTEGAPETTHRCVQHHECGHYCKSAILWPPPQPYVSNMLLKKYIDRTGSLKGVAEYAKEELQKVLLTRFLLPTL